MRLRPSTPSTNVGTQCGLTTQTWSVPLKAFPYDKQWRDGTAVAEIETDAEGTPEWVAPASLSTTVKVVTPRT